MQLDQLKTNEIARIAAIDWDVLGEIEGRRLRDLGFDPGVEVETLHRGWLVFRDPIAVRVGRMTVAIRAAHARAITVEAIAA